MNSCKTFRLFYSLYVSCMTVILVSAKDCSVTVRGPQPNKPCVFPFEFSRQIYYSCTDEKDPGNFWCSTKVDKDGKHIGGAKEWGYCAEGCDGSSSTEVQSDPESVGKESVIEIFRHLEKYNKYLYEFLSLKY